MSKDSEPQVDPQKHLDKQDTSATTLSENDDTDDAERSTKIVYTTEELDAMRQVRDMLQTKHEINVEERVGLKFLAVATINCKLRVAETVQKLVKLLECLKDLQCPDGIPQFSSLPTDDEAILSMLQAYAKCGPDFNGGSVFWIKGSKGSVAKKEERSFCHAGIVYFLAIHADVVSLRKGITFVIDVSSRKSTEPNVGNEKACQKFQQSFPLRPQAIYIAGANAVMRVFVNATIKVASLFTKQKILDRIKFVTVDQAKAQMPLSSAPTYVGGGGGGGENDVVAWVKERLAQLPAPDLLDKEDDSSSVPDLIEQPNTEVVAEAAAEVAVEAS